MRNRALHAALRNFALEAAALLSDDLRAGAEVEFDVVEEGGPRGPVLYHYQPRVHAFVDERWPRLRELPSCDAACRELGAGASTWLRMNGLRGEQAEPALQAMLERLYEDATSFGFPEERFERVYSEVEGTLYRDAVRARVLAPLAGASMDAERVELGHGLALVRGDLVGGAPKEAVFPEGGDGEPALLCVLERDVPAGEPVAATLAAERFASVVRAMRLWAPGQVRVGTPAWRSFGGGPWEAVPVGAAGLGAARSWRLPAGEEEGLRDFFAVVDAAEPPPTVAWALGRFEMGCERLDPEALPDFLLALRALLDATSGAGEASLALRVAALCAEEGSRRAVQRRVQAALALERFVIGGGRGMRADAGSPRELVAELEGHLRALLRDVICGYLDADLRSVADEILLEAAPEPFAGEIHARDLRGPAPAWEEELERFEPEPEPDTAELEPVAAEPARGAKAAASPAMAPAAEAAAWAAPVTRDVAAAAVAAPWSAAPATQDVWASAPAHQPRLDGVTPSADWAWSDDPEDYSAPV
jgi:hypothetical protein